MSVMVAIKKKREGPKPLPDLRRGMDEGHLAPESTEVRKAVLGWKSLQWTWVDSNYRPHAYQG